MLVKNKKKLFYVFIKTKSKYKPLYNQFIKLRQNALNKKKLLRLNRKKFEKTQHYYKKRLKWYNRYKIFDINQYKIVAFANRGTSYQRRFRDTLQTARKFRLYYGYLSKKYLKNKLILFFNKKFNKKKINNFRSFFLNIFEQRLDNILYKTKFCYSVKNAQQLILHGRILVNKKQIKIPSYLIKQGDLISIDPKYFFFIERNFKKRVIDDWPIPHTTKDLTINFKTMEILVHNTQSISTTTYFPYYFNLKHLIINYKKQ
jgi:small subunit ribosomal protein S4